MPRRDVLVGVGLAVALLEIAAGVAGIVWLGPAKIALVVLLSGLATGALSVALRPLLEPPSPEDGEGGAATGSGDDPPPWWPGFEADFWAHVRERDRAAA